ncbi:MAG TPA: pyridoxamine 5'-phosphate oxidase family protein [Hydrogenophaga sp.]|nr:pyridoxamine 5'-phosphate oxidase family protein [Hydrogenophaga sp.]
MQARAGVAEQLDAVGSRVMRSFMPDQHREFFGLLPFVLVGSVDEHGQPWASALAGTPGFMEAPTPHVLNIHGLPGPLDPLATNLREGAPVGLLGLQPHTRRRNRLNGVVSMRSGGWQVRVDQSFGNCPKYIQAREPHAWPDAPPATLAHEGTALDTASRELISRADTFFVATAHPDALRSPDPAHGVDVSHRGGPPGFVRLQGDTLTVPDFHGNFYFNTLGNLVAHPLAGLLFVDFDRGDLLWLATTGELHWDGPVLADFPGAQRVVQFRVRQVRRVRAALPLHWSSGEISPHLAGMGPWRSPSSPEA